MNKYLKYLKIAYVPLGVMGAAILYKIVHFWFESMFPCEVHSYEALGYATRYCDAADFLSIATVMLTVIFVIGMIMHENL